ncbi:MAG: SLBB domain-containing protein [Spirochaetaceae bacterium]|jgi:electron transport complex protein RnfC|nr:SLBB domain-containing protein [Spirochaetaceae bacterium]
MKVYSFPHGGISFEDPTAPPRDESALSFLPSLSIVPLVAQNGSRSLPVVKPGDTVCEGQLIARRQGAGSANVHSPVPGKILENTTWNIARGVLCNSMVIRMEGAFSLLGKTGHDYDWRTLSPFELRELITEFGVVDMDGTGVPVSDTISLFHRAHEPVTLLVRCVFDDPWLAADYVLCQERVESIALGALITARAAHASKIVLAVSEPEKKLGINLLEKISTEAEATLVLVGSRYPQRNTRELEIVLHQYERKEKQHFGALLCMGPATLAAICDAVTLHKPVLDRYIAVGGSAVRRPRVLKARLGSRLEQLFDECGGFTARPKRTAIGSPLLGRPVFSLDEPVTAASYAVFAIRDEHGGFNKNPRVLDLRTRSRLGAERPASVPFKLDYARANKCIGCGECRTVCPVGLDPEDLYKMLIARVFSRELGLLTARCHGCGCCEAVCPSRLPLSRLIINPAGGGS